VANLYAFESGLGMPSRSLFFIAKSIPRTTGAILASLMVAAGVLLTVIRIGRWAIGGFGPFTQTQSLLTSLALVVWGMQILSTIFVLSLFVGVAQDRPEQTEELFGHEE
jgi:hypothetical protein